MVSESQSCVALTKFLVDRTTTSGTPDWSRVERLAEAHEITPYIYCGLVAAERADVPPRLKARLEQAYESSTQRNLVLRDEFLVVLKGMREVCIEVIPYKEPLTFSVSNPDIGMRRFKDLDFLVDIGDLGGIRDVLKGLGYETEKPEEHYLQPGFEHLDKDYSFIRKSAWTTGSAVPGSYAYVGKLELGWVILEPHWSVTHPRLNVELPVQALRARVREIEYEGERINVLSPEDTLLVACIVGGKSEWRSLKLVADVAMAIENSPELDWDACLERANRARVRRMFLLGCLLASQIAATAIPEEMKLAAMREGRLAGMAQDVQRDVGNESASTRVDPRRFSLRMLHLREHRRDRWRYAIDTLTAPSSVELRLLPLPRPLRFVYRLVVPFTRYVAIPIGRRMRELMRRFSESERSKPTS
jgi:hypothetical protein